MMRIDSDAFMFLDFESVGEITKSKNLKIDCVTTPEEIKHISISEIEFLIHFIDTIFAFFRFLSQFNFTISSMCLTIIEV